MVQEGTLLERKEEEKKARKRRRSPYRKAWASARAQA
jgi:hypothetical protein